MNRGVLITNSSFDAPDWDRLKSGLNLSLDIATKDIDFTNDPVNFVRAILTTINTAVLGGNFKGPEINVEKLIEESSANMTLERSGYSNIDDSGVITLPRDKNGYSNELRSTLFKFLGITKPDNSTAYHLKDGDSLRSTFASGSRIPGLGVRWFSRGTKGGSEYLALEITDPTIRAKFSSQAQEFLRK